MGRDSKTIVSDSIIDLNATIEFIIALKNVVDIRVKTNFVKVVEYDYTLILDTLVNVVKDLQCLEFLTYVK